MKTNQKIAQAVRGFAVTGALLTLGAMVVAGAATLKPSGTEAADGGPFASLAGYWSGSGAITLKQGAREPIRCRATYFISDGGSTLAQNIRCASTSYKIEIKSRMVARGGRVTGSWQETNFAVNGSLSGRASGGQLNLSVNGQNFSARMNVNTSGSRQNVSIGLNNLDVSRVSISLGKG